MSRKNSTKDFEFETCIGEGSYSKVYKAVSIHNHRTYAIKVLNKSHIVKEKKIKYVNIEKNTLNKLGHHPGIVTLHYTFQDSESLYYVIDFALNGELLSLIRKWGSLSEPVSKYYAIQLVDAVEFIHSKGIIHRDLKPENILLNHDYKLMITDFGAAKILDTSNTQVVEDTKNEYPDSRAGSFVGTAEYVSPELLKYNQCGFECDNWAIGCVLYQLITGYPPFKGTTEYLTFEKIIKLDYKFPAYYIPSKIKHLISNLLVLKPEQRYSINDIKNHEWFKDLNWLNKDYIWKRRVPKFESYNPKFYAIKKDNNNSSIITQKTRFDSSKFYVPQGLQLKSNINSIPDHVLQKQIMTPQTNQQAMNKALTQRLILKNNELNQRQRNAASLASAAANASRNGNGKILPKVETSNFQSVNNKTRIITTPTTTQSSSPKFTSNSTLKKQTTRPSLKSPATSAPSPTLSLQQLPHIASSKSSSLPPLTKKLSSSNSSYQTPPPSNNINKSPSTAINSMGTLMKNTFSNNKLMTNRSARSHSNAGSKSISPPPVTPPPFMSNEIIDLVPLSSVADIPLLQDEYILKADNIHKSELPYSLPPSEDCNLDDSVLNKLIDENYDDLNKGMKSSLLIITSLGRLLIYEFTLVGDNTMSTLDPKFNMMMNTSTPKVYKETKLIVVNLTNKNISMYEFDGVFIIKDNYSPNIIVLNPLEEQSISPRQFPSPSAPFADAEPPCIKINPDTSWIDTLLKAKELLKSSSATSTPSSSSEFSTPEEEVSVSPIEEIEKEFGVLRTTEERSVKNTTTTTNGGGTAVAAAAAGNGTKRSSPLVPQTKTLGTKTRTATRSSSSSKVYNPGSSSSPQMTSPPTRSSSNSSIPYHYTQQQKSHPHAHQANFAFLAQTKQNKFASAAAAASFKK